MLNIELRARYRYKVKAVASIFMRCV